MLLIIDYYSYSNSIYTIITNSYSIKWRYNCLFFILNVDQRDYKSVLYDMLEESYKSSPYVTSLKKELENVKTTLQFMVEKEGHIW